MATPPSKRPPANDVTPDPKPTAPATELSLGELAQGILDRKIKPRVADLRRLAESVLAAGAKSAKKKKKGPGKKSDEKKRKLAKIAGQKKKQPK